MTVYLRKHLKSRKVYLGSWFRGFQSMVGSHHCYGPEMRQDIMVAGVCV